MTDTVWLFDLDNTLHNAANGAFKMIDRSMNDYIARELKVSSEEANRLRHDYWACYGATLLGLVRHHGVRASHFLEQTHVLPHLEERLHAHPHDVAALKRLPGKKYILTNAPRSYTARVLRALGMQRLFDGVIAVDDMRMFGHWRPKPDKRMFRWVTAKLKVPPQRCVLVEDTLAHQKAARAVGLRTIWMQRWTMRASHGPEVGIYLHRRPSYVCARIRSLQQLQEGVRL